MATSGMHRIDLRQSAGRSISGWIHHLTREDRLCLQDPAETPWPLCSDLDLRMRAVCRRPGAQMTPCAADCSAQGQLSLYFFNGAGTAKYKWQIHSELGMTDEGWEECQQARVQMLSTRMKHQPAPPLTSNRDRTMGWENACSEPCKTDAQRQPSSMAEAVQCSMRRSVNQAPGREQSASHPLCPPTWSAKSARPQRFTGTREKIQGRRGTQG
jgi:hypothetical protein